MELVEVLMNPVRQRIFQYLLVHETGTVKEIKKALLLSKGNKSQAAKLLGVDRTILYDKMKKYEIQ